MVRQTGKVASIGQFLEEIDKSRLRDEWGSHVRIWFRGHADLVWNLEPGIYRHNLRGNEDEQITAERHLTQDFMSYSARLLSGNESDAEMYFIQQHYKMPTRLLDWSGNPLAALYFAVPEDKDHADGEIFMLDSYGFKGGHKTIRHADYQKAMECIFGTSDRWPDHIMAVRPPAHDPRIIAQSGYFTFHPKGNRYLDDKSNSTLRSFVIPAAAKATIRKDLEVMNFNEFTVYGDLDHLASWLRGRYPKN